MGQRIDADGVGQVGDGAIDIALLTPEQTAIVVGKGVPRIEADRLGIVGQRAVQIALGLPGETPRDMGDRVHGVAFARVFDDERATGDVAIRIVGVAIVMRRHARGKCRRRDRHQHASN